MQALDSFVRPKPEHPTKHLHLSVVLNFKELANQALALICRAAVATKDAHSTQLLYYCQALISNPAKIFLVLLFTLLKLTPKEANTPATE